MSTGYSQQVVVQVKCRIERHEQSGFFAARILELGLTGYGPSEDDAIEDCKLIFRRFIHAYRNAGNLDSVLTRAGVQWYPRDEYPTDSLVPEDTNELFRNQVEAGSIPASILEWPKLTIRESYNGTIRDYTDRADRMLQANRI